MIGRVKSSASFICSHCAIQYSRARRGIFATAAQKMLLDEAELLTASGVRSSIRLVYRRRRAAKGIEVGEEARAPNQQ